MRPDPSISERRPPVLDLIVYGLLAGFLLAMLIYVLVSGLPVGGDSPDPHRWLGGSGPMTDCHYETVQGKVWTVCIDRNPE